MNHKGEYLSVRGWKVKFRKKPKRVSDLYARAVLENALDDWIGQQQVRLERVLAICYRAIEAPTPAETQIYLDLVIEQLNSEAAELAMRQLWEEVKQVKWPTEVRNGEEEESNKTNEKTTKPSPPAESSARYARSPRRRTGKRRAQIRRRSRRTYAVDEKRGGGQAAGERPNA